MTRDFSVFFCIGVQKSGTTLLARVLDQHPQIACIWESYALRPTAGASIFNPASKSWRNHGFREADVRRWARLWRRRAPPLARKVVKKLLRYDLLGRHAFARTMPATLADFAARCGATVVGDKWPWYIDYLQEVVDALPDAKFIYNVRDPRGLWNSAQRFKGRKRGDEILDEMLRKERSAAPFLARPNFLTLRYEELVLAPESTARRLYAFLGCDFSPDYLYYDPAADPYPQRWEWVPEASGPIDPWHAHKWREQVPPEVIERINVRAAWFLDKYGYEA